MTTTNRINLMDLIIEQKNETTRYTRTKAFTDYTSKKKLFAANILTPAQTTVLNQLKNTFTFSMHNDLRYMVITLYFSNTKKYSFLVLDLLDMGVLQAESVKKAKELVLDMVKEQIKEEGTPENTDVEPVTVEETPENTDVEELKEDEKPAKGQKKGNKKAAARK